MRILVLGGTVFLGRHIVETALARGHELTLFNRGQSNPGLFPGVETVIGDRMVTLSALENGHWDSVIDVAGYVPRVVRMAAALAARQASHFVFISTISVYPSFPRRGMDESSATGSIDDPTREDVTGESYGPLKALSEQAAEEEVPGRTLVIRPGLIVGPHDTTDRFTYWPHRIAAGREVLAPVGPEVETQVIDVRDLADWTVRMVEAHATGVFNATGQPMALGGLLDVCREESGSDATFTWVSEAFLAEEKVAPWSNLPLWIGGAPDYAGFASIDCSRAYAAGLTMRPMAETVRDTVAWDRTRAPGPLKAGLAPERERELLARWHQSGGIDGHS